MFRGDRLKQLRESRGYTHQELANMLDVAYPQIYRYEAGKNDPPSRALDRMASVFDVSIDYLCGRTDNPTPEFRLDGLSESERRAIAAWRQGNIRGAVLEIVQESADDQEART